MVTGSSTRWIPWSSPSGGSAGTKDNIIPRRATLELTVRTFSQANRDRVHDAIRRVVDGITAAHGMTGETTTSMGYPVTVNDDTEYAFPGDGGGPVQGPTGTTSCRIPRPAPGFLVCRATGSLGPRLPLACPAGDPDRPDNPTRPRICFDDAVLPDQASCSPRSPSAVSATRADRSGGSAAPSGWVVERRGACRARRSAESSPGGWNGQVRGAGRIPGTRSCPRHWWAVPVPGCRPRRWRRGVPQAASGGGTFPPLTARFSSPSANHAGT